MNSAGLFLTLISIILFYYAYNKDIKEGADAYIDGNPKNNNNVPTLLQKVLVCCGYDMNTIKWRGALMTTIPIIILIFLTILSRLPSPQEYIISFIIIFSIIYGYKTINMEIHAKKSYEYAEKCVKLLEKQYNLKQPKIGK